ncbi:hypothetical protein IHQ68_14700 [Chelatococcus sambhunathii]|uniref:Uncharacterized protein n=1 Tax=Chelatococcus sambhunathii TaxID=363953 RepID=A0ABU1DIA7_9HYPH|nr:hypothetical protein [Chelatococcus sambhunathii]MDR4307871.1 hypothetical protein [Chelatococcus sambhunathii]
MSELFRTAACGLAASLMMATSAFAIEASSTAAAPADGDAQQAVELVSAGVAAKPADDPNCPTVTLAPAGDSRKADGAQATLDALARDCANLGAETIVKVGVVGESVRKKAKDTAQVDAPMTIQIKDASGHEIETRRINLKVEMPEGVQKVSFQHVEENVSLPPPSAEGYANWTIVVGLDPAEGGDAGDEVASAEEQIEEPATKSSRSGRSTRSARSYRSKSARAKAVRYARASRSGRQRIELQPQPAPVVVSAKPQGASGAQVTTTVVNANNGGVMARAAQGFTERRDKALAEQRQQQAAASRQQGRAPQPASRSAQAQPVRGPATQTAQTN